MYNQDIVGKVMGGDLDAFSKMYNDCAPAVYRRAYSLLEDPVLARETVRNVFRDIRKHIDALPDARDFDEWVFRLVNMHVTQLKNNRQQLWDEPDLRGVWDEITAEDGQTSVQSPESIIETLARMRMQEDRGQAPQGERIIFTPSNAAQGDPQPSLFYDDIPAGDGNALSFGGSAEEWEPILFPPEEDGGQGAAELPLEGMPTPAAAAPAQPKVILETAEPAVDTPQQTEDAQDGEDVLFPLAPEPVKKDGNRKRKRIRYEAARASTHFSVERVPYDYIPYEETSQEAYDRVSFEETPRAVYEHIPYERPAKEDLVDAQPDVSYTTIPYAAKPQKEPVLQDTAIIEAPEKDVALESAGESMPGTFPPTEAAAPSTSPSKTSPDVPFAHDAAPPLSPVYETATAANTLSHDWQDVDPVQVDVDEVLQEIVAEVDGIQIEQRGDGIIAEQLVLDDAIEESAVASSEPPVSASEPATVTNADHPAPVANHAPVPSAAASPLRSSSLPEEKNVTPPPLEDATEYQPKKRSWLAGAGFFAGAVVVLGGILFLGHYLNLW